MKKIPAGFKHFASFIALLLFSTILMATSQGRAQEAEKEKIKDIKISGNLRVEEDGIRLHLKSRPGDLYNSKLVEQDVKAIFRMGFFDDVSADLSPEGVLTYTVKEKPYIREVKIQGNSQVTRDKIDTALGIAPRTVLDRSKVAEGVEKVRKLYGEQGYVNAAIDYSVNVESNNQAVVTVDITEGTRLLIKRVTFEGNRAFSDSELKGLMATKPEWIFSFITNRGVLDRDVLTNDIAILSNHYYDNGYIDHKIDEPLILKAKDGLEVVIRINEGEQYRIGKVEIGGDLVLDGRQMLKGIQITPGQIFRGSRLRDDLKTLTDLYTDKGFAFVQIDPLTKVNAAEKNVDIQLLITKGPPVYFNRVLVAGNTKTRDYVVRRELLATEQELYSGFKITQSKNALQRSGYFEDVNLTTKKTDQPDTVDVLVDVKEGPTGNFSIGAGYSSGDGFLFNASVAEKNLMGRGQGVNGSASLGSKRHDFVVGFTEPYLNGSNVNLGLDGFNTQRDYTDFTEKKLGFGVRTSYPLKDWSMPFFGAPKVDLSRGSDELASAPPVTMWDYMRGGMAYELTHDDIGGVSKNASEEIKKEEGVSLTSSMTPSLSYDSRDHFFFPTEGTKSAFAVKFAGLGGNTQFIKSDLSARWHYSLLKDPNWGGSYVLALGGSLGYGGGFSQSDLPLFERYFIGGINSVRGFTDRSIAPRTNPVCVSSINSKSNVSNIPGKKLSSSSCSSLNGQIPDPIHTGQVIDETFTYSGGDVIGGDKAAVFNAELLFPIAEQYGLRGVAFFDVGNSWNGGFNLGEFRRSVGVGARWMSPFGPLRVELGFPLSKQPHDETSILGFSIGSQP
ncbi:MAG: outer membrane protein assembly factor BamA [Alphaproteobacteria bacterium]